MKNLIELKKPSQLLSLIKSDTVGKIDLFRLIQFSKQSDSEFWEDDNWIINNTPQQGINWVGTYPHLKAVIIKTRKGSYAEDGWKNTEKTLYSYSFKAKNGNIDFNDKANKSLINQPQHGYPLILFLESRNTWIFQGYFQVINIYERNVLLEKVETLCDLSKNHDEINNKNINSGREYQEGRRKYINHLISERNRTIISEIKEKNDWICDICNINFSRKYDKNYIEAHHKIPLHTYSKQHIVTEKDYALLCPNCHKAVHLYMAEENLSYEDTKEKIKNILERG